MQWNLTGVHLYSITYIFESHAVALTCCSNYGYGYSSCMLLVVSRIQKWCNTYSRPWESTNSMCFLLHSKDSMDLAWEEICLKFVLESSYRLSCFIKFGVQNPADPAVCKTESHAKKQLLCYDALDVPLHILRLSIYHTHTKYYFKIVSIVHHWCWSTMGQLNINRQQWVALKTHPIKKQHSFTIKCGTLIPPLSSITPRYLSSCYWRSPINDNFLKSTVNVSHLSSFITTSWAPA